MHLLVESASSVIFRMNLSFLVLCMLLSATSCSANKGKTYSIDIELYVYVCVFPI